MHYFSYISNSYACKNKLEKAVLEVLQDNARKIYTVEELPMIQQFIEICIDSCNANFHRCKPVKVTWYQIDNGDVALYLSRSICNFFLYSSKN